MPWKVGQDMQCDRPGRQLAHCFVISNDEGSVTISCPNEQMVVCGRQSELEKLGWMVRSLNPSTLQH